VTVSARSVGELKQKLRKQMGWSPRLSWKSWEWDAIKARFELLIDYKRNVFRAVRK